MPQEKIIIKFEPEGHEKLINAINRLNVATQNFKNQTLGTTKAMGAFEQRNTRLTDTNNKGAKAFSTIRSKLLLFNFAMGLGVAQLIKFTQQAAKLQDVRRAFDTLQGGAGRGAIAIDKLKEATDGAVSEFDLFQQANNAMILGVTKNSDEMAEMFDIAQRLGQALGKDTRLSVESLITGIGRQSRMMLDNIGIVVDVEKANKAYAKQLGINADKLTDQERKTAFLNATMDAARKKVAGLGEEQLSNSQEMEKMKVAVIESAAALGEALMPVVIPLAKALTALAKGAKVVFEAFDPSKLGVAFTESAEEISFLKDMLAETEKTMKGLGAEQLTFQGMDMGLGFKEMSSELQPLMDQYVGYKDRIVKLEEKLRKLFETEGDLSDTRPEELTSLEKKLANLKLTTAVQEEFTEAVKDNLKWTLHEETSVKNRISQLGELKTKLDEAAEWDQAAILEQIKLKEQQMALSLGYVFSLGEEKNALREIAGINEMMAKFEPPKTLAEQAEAIINENEINALLLTEEEKQRIRDHYADLQIDQDNEIIAAKIKIWAKGISTLENIIGVNSKNAKVVANIQAVAATVDAFGAAQTAWNMAQKHPANLATSGGYAAAMYGITLASGLAQAAATKAAADKMEQGGLIGGRRHSQGGTMINAEAGEFVMNRGAVDSVGIENLNAMNAGGGGGSVTVNVSGNVMSSDYVEGELADQIKEAVRRGADFGVS